MSAESRLAMLDPSPSATSEMDPWPLDARAWGEVLAAFGLLATVGLLLGWILLGPLTATGLDEWDESVAYWWDGVRTAQWDTWTSWGSALSDTDVIIGALLVLVPLFAWIWKRWRESLTLALALFLESSVFLTVSLMTGRDRPPIEQLDASPPTASFPSGHTGAAFAFYYTILLIVYWNTEKTVYRTLAFIVALIVPPTVAASRMYRGMHYVTDVSVGAVLGLICLPIAAWIVHRAIARRQSGEELSA